MKPSYPGIPMARHAPVPTNAQTNPVHLVSHHITTRIDKAPPTRHPLRPPTQHLTSKPQRIHNWAIIRHNTQRQHHHAKLPKPSQPPVRHQDLRQHPADARPVVRRAVDLAAYNPRTHRRAKKLRQRKREVHTRERRREDDARRGVRRLVNGVISREEGPAC